MSSKKTFIPIPFSQWLLENGDDLRKEFNFDSTVDEKCMECWGEGYATCDMGHDHECEECDGEGVLTRERAFEEYARDMYNEQVNKDKKRFWEYEKFMELAVVN